jgi:hypothetical protein
MTKINTTPLEAQEQQILVQELERLQNQGKITRFTAIPNSTYTKSWSQKIKNKQQGLRGGLPDIFILAQKKNIWIEMKRQKGGVVSPEQKAWIEDLNSTPNTYAEICCGFDQAKMFLERILAM